MLIAHLSDLHIDLGQRNAARARAVAEYVARLNPRPELVVVTGDVADHGEAAEYDHVPATINLFRRRPDRSRGRRPSRPGGPAARGARARGAGR